MVFFVQGRPLRKYDLGGAQSVQLVLQVCAGQLCGAELPSGDISIRKANRIALGVERDQIIIQSLLKELLF